MAGGLNRFYRSVRLSSEFDLKLFRSSVVRVGNSGGPRLVGQMSTKVIDLINTSESRETLEFSSVLAHYSSDGPLPLMNKGKVDKGARVALKINHPDMPTADPPNEIELATQQAQAVPGNIARLDSSGTHTIDTASRAIDTTSSIATKAQSAYDAAQTLGSCFQSLGPALQHLDKIVAIVDGLAEVGRPTG